MDSHNTHNQNESHPTLSETESVEVLTDVSSLIFESALGRLLLELEEDSLTELEQYLSQDHEPEQLIEHLLVKYPTLRQLIDEESVALEEKAQALNS